MTRRALVLTACAVLVVVLVAVAFAGLTPRLPSAAGIKVAPASASTAPAELFGQVRGINASSPPRYEGCVCSLVSESKTYNVVTKDVLVQNVLLAGFTTQKGLVVVATKLPAPPTGATGWPGGDWYQVQEAMTVNGQ